MAATPSGRSPRWGTNPRQKHAWRVRCLKAPRPARLPNPKPTTINPPDSRDERGTTGGQVTTSAGCGSPCKGKHASRKGDAVRGVDPVRHRRGKLKPATGGRAPKAQGNGGGRGKRSALQDRVARRIAGTRDLTTAGLAVRIAATHGTGVHRGSVWRLLRDLGLTHEKDLRAAGQKWPEVAAAGHIRITRRQPFMANLLTRIGFIGETRLKTDMAKADGAGPARRTPVRSRGPGRPGLSSPPSVTTGLRHDRSPSRPA